MPKLYLIDGHALIFRMYYAFLRRPMVNSKGQDMSILYGFTKYILELLEKEKPSHFAVAFDPPGGTFRNRMFPEYKANRPPTPDLIKEALQPLTEICKALNIPVLMIPDYEADDVIGTVASRGEAAGMDVYMVTPDKDYGQLITDRIRQVKPGKAGGPDEVFGKEEVCAKYSISEPSQVIEMLAICGDTADNVPGVKGVGEVGAAKLIAKYGTVEEIYRHLDELTPKQRLMFEEAQPHMQLTHELVTICKTVPVDADPMSLVVDRNYSQRVQDLFNYYEFGSLKKHLAGRITRTDDATSAGVPNNGAAAESNIDTPECPEVLKASAEDVLEAASKARRCSVMLTDSKEQVVVAARRNDAAISAQMQLAQASALLADAAVEKCGSDMKPLIKSLAAEGIALNGRLLDAELMHYLLNPESSHELDVLAQSFLGMDLDLAPADDAGNGLLFGAEDDDDDAAKDYSMQAAAPLFLADILSEKLAESGAMGLYDTMEEPLVRVLARMEMAGVKLDLASLKDFAADLRTEMLQREARVRELAGEPVLNVSSPKQIGAVLFEKLQLDPKAKKSAKGSWSTDESTLLDLADKHPIVDEILEYRGVKKLLSTYIEPFPEYISPLTGKVHTTFNQALTATGRLSSSNPNLQNIPIRTERGKEIRKAFVPSRPGGLIMAADYSQIELRIMAHLSCDEHMIAAFKQGIDVHAATAAKIFGIPHEDVTKDQRRIAKTANFGIMYGISAFGLAQRLRIARSDAKKVIEDYFAGFPAISSYINDTLDAARENGYVETLFGRRRYLPDINARNAVVRQLAERTAVNAPIQGTSADIIKLAMIAVDKRLQESGLKSRMVLQIHDELVFDTVPEEVEQLKALVVREMENVVALTVPLTVECNYGTNWLEAH